MINEVSSARELILNSLIEFKNRSLFIYEKCGILKTCSFEKFSHDVYRFSNYIYKNFGNQPRIAVLAENSYQWIVTYFSCLCGTGPLFIFDKDFTPVWIINTINKCKIDILVVDKVYGKLLDTYLAKLNNKPIIIEIDSDEALSKADLTFDIILNDEESSNKLFSFDDYPATDMRIVYTTSGTEQGYRKKVMLSLTNIMTDMFSEARLGDYKESSSTILVLPLCHSYISTMCVIRPIILGHTVYIDKSPQNLERDLINYNPHYLTVVPAVMCQMLKRYKFFMNKIEGFTKEKYFGKNLKAFICGGAALPGNIIAQFEKLGYNVRYGYGVTECSPVVAENVKLNDKESVGNPLDCCVVKILNGEIVVCGSNVMIGYLDEPQLTQMAIVDGWFHTGDAGFIGDDGALYVTGRIKNVIVLSNGVNVFPEEVEERFYALPEVQECIVFEYKRNGLLSMIVYYNHDVNVLKEVEDAVRKLNINLPLSRRISKMIFTDSPLKKTLSNKISRASLDDQADFIILRNNIIELIKERLLFDVDINGETSFIDDLNFDSLEYMSFSVDLEKKVGIRIPLDELATKVTVNDICEYLVTIYTR
jgi:long-chain acyl-CoA synthetase